jgi:2-dehydropantoate 2-reductase
MATGPGFRFVVLGAGAIGAYVGAALARAGSDVTLIARGPHLQAILEHGVRVRSPRGDFESRPAATADIGAVADADVVFVGLKAYSLAELAPTIGPLLRPGAVVVFAQNGIPWWYFQGHGGPLAGRVLESVDPGGAISRAIAPERVVGCVVYCSTEIAAPGVIRHTEGTRFSIGTPGGEPGERCQEISAAFRAAGLKCPVDRDLRPQIWLKLLGNAVINPLTTITGSTMGALAGSPHAVAFVREVMEECAAVAGALAIELPVSIDRRLEAALAVGDHKTSMLQDWEAGKPLESDCLTGAVVEIADALGVPVPSTRVLHSLIKALEELRGA